MNSLGPRNWMCSGILPVRISFVFSEENHYSNHEVDELGEQKVNFKSLKVSQINKRVNYGSSLKRTNEGGGGLCVIHPAAPWRKQMDQDSRGIGQKSSFPDSKSTNKQTNNKQTGGVKSKIKSTHAPASRIPTTPPYTNIPQHPQNTLYSFCLKDKEKGPAAQDASPRRTPRRKMSQIPIYVSLSYILSL